MSHTILGRSCRTGLYCPTGGASLRMYLPYRCYLDYCLSKPKKVMDFFLADSVDFGARERVAVVGLCGLALSAWLRAHREKSPIPEGSVGLRIILLFIFIPLLPQQEEIQPQSLIYYQPHLPSPFIRSFDYIMATQKHNDLVFKVIVVGDSGSGKSCLIQRYLTNEFMQDYTVTLGVEYHSKSVKIDGNISVKLQFWDTAGQEAFNSLVKAFYRNAHAVVLVFDITRRQTFENLDLWQQQALENSPQDAFYILIGTHLDLASSRQVSTLQAEQWIKQAQVNMYFETSAKTAQNVVRAFQQASKQLLLRNLRRAQQREQGFRLAKERQSNFCC